MRKQWNNIKWNNTYIIGIPEEIGMERDMFENFLNLGKEIDIQILKVQKDSNKMNPKRPSPRHTIRGMSNVRILNSAR